MGGEVALGDAAMLVKGVEAGRGGIDIGEVIPVICDVPNRPDDKGPDCPKAVGLCDEVWNPFCPVLSPKAETPEIAELGAGPLRPPFIPKRAIPVLWGTNILCLNGFEPVAWGTSRPPVGDREDCI